MSLAPGTRLGPYEIVSPLGAGGMGEVYRARDTKLARDVAIKILPELFASDPERLARFEREAKTLASLNHPHIAQIYGVEDRALVMELVEGPTLAEREMLTVREALQIAAQIADALDCAHEKGIVHRDLKPANVKIREDGTVKVLDFGLAKAMSPDTSSGSADAAHSPTFTSPAMTQQGMILGTAAYMSPEQARGKAVDKRADIWAFGVVLFELLSGKQLFRGESITDTLAALLRQDIPWNDLPPDTPPSIRRLLERLLERDPRQRLRDVGDAKLEIADVLEGRGVSVVAPVAAPASRSRRFAFALPWTIAALAVAAAVGLWLFGGSRGAVVNGAWSQFTPITDAAGEERSPSISPDGSTIAYATRAQGTWDVYVQRVGGRTTTPVAADPDRDEAAPAFSPDGRSIAFHEADGDGGIFVVGATGESSRRITDAGFHPAWSPDGARIAFSSEEIDDPLSRQGVSQLWIVDAGGGAPQRVDGGGDIAQPSWSPSGRRIVFWSNTGGQRDIYSIPAAGGTRVPLVVDAALDWSPVWSPDGASVHFTSDRGGALNMWRIGVDEATGRPSGPPEAVTAGVLAGLEQPSMSKDGARLAFRSRLSAFNPVSIPFDPETGRAGTPTILSNANTTLFPNDISPDGRWLALYGGGQGPHDIFISAIDGSGLRNLTADAARDRSPVWTADGSKLLFYSNRGGTWEGWMIGRDGGNLQKIVGGPGLNVIYPLLSPSGDRVVHSDGLRRQVFITDVAANGAPRLLPNTSVDDASFSATSWSRDGARLAGLLTLASGSPVGVGVYDLTAQAVRKVSDDKVSRARWLADSRRVMYFTVRGELVVLDTVTLKRSVVDVRFPLPTQGALFALSRDDRTIVYSGGRVESDIWIVEREKR